VGRRKLDRRNKFPVLARKPIASCTSWFSTDDWIRSQYVQLRPMLRFESFGRIKPSFGYYWVLGRSMGWHVFSFAKAEDLFQLR
jgi:hypothetical protein